MGETFAPTIMLSPALHLVQLTAKDFGIRILAPRRVEAARKRVTLLSQLQPLMAGIRARPLLWYTLSTHSAVLWIVWVTGAIDQRVHSLVEEEHTHNRGSLRSLRSVVVQPVL